MDDINAWLSREHVPGETNLEYLLYMVREIAPRCGSEGPFEIYFADGEWEVTYVIRKPAYLDHAWETGEVLR